MTTYVDENIEIIKTCWDNVREQISRVEPRFTQIIDELSPDKSFSIYLAYYPYGEIIKNTHTLNANIARDINSDQDSFPMTMLLDKNLEIFIDLKDEKISIPWQIYSPGDLFPFSHILRIKNQRIYAPNGLLMLTSGARSVFMLPNIGCFVNHVNLQGDFNIQLPPPKSLYEHWEIFKAISNSGVIENDWRSCVAFFSEKWVNKIHTDKKWLKLKAYILELAWRHFEYERNHIYYNITFSIIQKNRNLKPNPYLADTARHLFTIALGAAPGYIPAIQNNALPLRLLQKVFVESYGLKKYFPTIMQPTHFNFETDPTPVYYSLQNPSTFVFSPRSRKTSSTLLELRELEHITRIFSKELEKDSGMCGDTILNKLTKNVDFHYFHNEQDRHHVIKPTTEMIHLDNKFSAIDLKYKMHDAKFASDAPFLRGCIGIRRK